MAAGVNTTRAAKLTDHILDDLRQLQKDISRGTIQDFSVELARVIIDCKRLMEYRKDALHEPHLKMEVFT